MSMLLYNEWEETCQLCVRDLKVLKIYKNWRNIKLQTTQESQNQNWFLDWGHRDRKIQQIKALVIGAEI